jgi:hypothetical protein
VNQLDTGFGLIKERFTFSIAYRRMACRPVFFDPLLQTFGIRA